MLYVTRLVVTARIDALTAILVIHALCRVCPNVKIVPTGTYVIVVKKGDIIRTGQGHYAIVLRSFALPFLVMIVASALNLAGIPKTVVVVLVALTVTTIFVLLTQPVPNAEMAHMVISVSLSAAVIVEIGCVTEMGPVLNAKMVNMVASVSQHVVLIVEMECVIETVPA